MSKEIEEERQAYKEAANQHSLFDEDLAQLEPCPYAFIFDYEDEAGKSHTSTSDDWETAAMYRNFANKYGERETIAIMKKTFEEDYPAKGMAFAMGTHSRYPEVWLLVGVIRLDIVKQMSLEL